MTTVPPDANALLGRIPSGRFLLTAAHGELRRGVLVRWVQQCGHAPPMVILALVKGQALSPLIRDSRHFVLCALREDDLLAARLFGPEGASEGDPFLGLPAGVARCGAPIPTRSLWFAECEMVRHLDVESDCELYVGAVRQCGRVSDEPTPIVPTPVVASRGAAPTARPRSTSPRNAAGASATPPRRRGDPESEPRPTMPTAKTPRVRKRS
jgi:flavin reductase (DIM6/NTAB) family NADH-FMN oxidoreductase RutF